MSCLISLDATRLCHTCLSLLYRFTIKSELLSTLLVLLSILVWSSHCHGTFGFSYISYIQVPPNITYLTRGACIVKRGCLICWFFSSPVCLYYDGSQSGSHLFSISQTFSTWSSKWPSNITSWKEGHETETV
jgi:hypothetical protein